MNKSIAVKISELEKIPFIDAHKVGGRVITTLCFFEQGEWHFWIPTSAEGIIKVKGEPVESDYFARLPERDTDIYFDFLNFITQCACWPQVIRSIDGIRNDIHNLGASLGKISLFYKVSSDEKLEIARFASTELEYIFNVCRSIFDLLQEVIAGLWDKTNLLDKNIKKRQLPKSFREMVMKDEKLMEVDAIKTQHRIPLALAQFYHRHGSFFYMLRGYRNNIIHSGRDLGFVFVTKKGFAISSDTRPFASFGVWNSEHMLPNNLASLRPVVAHIITETFKACEDYSETIQQIIKFPPEVVPGFKLFVRGFHNHELLALKDVLSKCLWWDA